MLEQDAPGRQRGRSSGLDIVLATFDRRGPMRRAGEVGVLRNDQSQDDLRNALPENRSHDQRQQDRWHGKLQIHDPHQQSLYPAPEISGGQANADP